MYFIYLIVVREGDPSGAWVGIHPDFGTDGRTRPLNGPDGKFKTEFRYGSLWAVHFVQFDAESTYSVYLVRANVCTEGHTFSGKQHDGSGSGIFSGKGGVTPVRVADPALPVGGQFGQIASPLQAQGAGRLVGEHHLGGNIDGIGGSDDVGTLGGKRYRYLRVKHR